METRGYTSIVDRDTGNQNTWGPGVNLAAIPDADAPFEPPRDSVAQPEDRTDAERRWTRELEQRFSRKAVINTSIEDRARPAHAGETGPGAGGLTVNEIAAADNTTEITSGKEDAIDQNSYKVRVYNRPTHQGDVSQLEADFALDGAPFNDPDTPNADNRDRESGPGVTYEAENVVGAGAWNQSDQKFAVGTLPNANTEHESDYVDPDAAPVGAEDEE